MNEKVFLLPKEVENDSDYLIELKRIFEQYQDFLHHELKNLYFLNSQSDDTNWNIAMIVEKGCATCKSIIECINLYYRGNLIQSKQIIKQIISDIRKNDKNSFFVSTLDQSYATRNTALFPFLAPLSDAVEWNREKSKIPLSFFRARTDRVSHSYEMGHIPVNMRDKIGTQRFSIPGLPCLYLGTSSLDVWEELGRPSFHDFNVCAVGLTERGKQLSILNLTANMYLIQHIHFALTRMSQMEPIMRSKLYNLLETLYCIWPLVCATSFKVIKSTKLFHSEYIISHLIMMNLQEFNIDGVAYASKHITPNWDSLAFPQLINIAIPAFDAEINPMKEKIYESFRFTDPKNFEAYMALMNHKENPIPEYSYYHRICDKNMPHNYSIVMVEGITINYRNTQFCHFDNYLCQFETNQIL